MASTQALTYLAILIGIQPVNVPGTLADAIIKTCLSFRMGVEIFAIIEIFRT